MAAELRLTAPRCTMQKDGALASVEGPEAKAEGNRRRTDSSMSSSRLVIQIMRTPGSPSASLISSSTSAALGVQERCELSFRLFLQQPEDGLEKLPVQVRVDLKVPPDYDFVALFNREYGVIKDKPFRVEAEFTGFAAVFVVERIWSPDQKIVRKPDGGIRLIFSASSEPEVLSWVLSFGEEARLIKPKRLVRKMKEKIKRMDDVYSLIIKKGKHSKV